MRVDRIKLACEMARRDLNGKQLGEKAGLSRATITAVTSGKSCSAVTATKLASALGIPVEELVER